MKEPAYRIELRPPDITPYRTGNTGLDYVTTLDSGRPGPHVVINALTHGNELCGAIAIDFLFRAGVRPLLGRLTLCLANVIAYRAFSPVQPTASRYIDEDFNRLWSPEILDGTGDSLELRRARTLRAIYERADYLLDLHSMQHATAPLTLCGRTERGRVLACALGFPEWVVSDGGHKSGRRLIDYPIFAEEKGHQTALLVECGQHWHRTSASVAVETTLRLLSHLGILDRDFVGRYLPQVVRPRPKIIEVTDAVTVGSDTFTFAADYIGMERISRQGTVIAHDGDREIRTPYDECILIMPARRLKAGQTAVRLGRITGTCPD